MTEFLQLLLNGLAGGCIYGLVALGFVLIYKATEMVNFAQGDILMLGAFAAFTAIGLLGLDYWVGVILAVAAMFAFGYLLDAVVLRQVIGQPQFAIVMLTIGLGFVFRAAASMIWGADIFAFETPFSGSVSRIGGVIADDVDLSIIAGTLVLCAGLYAFFTSTRLGVAMQASSQNQLAAYYMGIPVKTVFSLIWAISAAVACIAGLLLAPKTLVDVNMGFIGIKAFAAAVLGGFGSIPGALVGGLIVGLIEIFTGVYAAEGTREVAPYLVILIVLFVRPEGLFGQVARKKV